MGGNQSLWGVCVSAMAEVLDLHVVCADGLCQVAGMQKTSPQSFPQNNGALKRLGKWSSFQMSVVLMMG